MNSYFEIDFPFSLNPVAVSNFNTFEWDIIISFLFLGSLVKLRSINSRIFFDLLWKSKYDYIAPDSKAFKADFSSTKYFCISLVKISEYHGFWVSSSLLKLNSENYFSRNYFGEPRLQAFVIRLKSKGSILIEISLWVKKRLYAVWRHLRDGDTRTIPISFHFKTFFSY